MIPIAVFAVVVLGYLFFFRGGEKQETLTVRPGDFLQQVSVSGKVIATEDLNLSFEQLGIVQGVYGKPGDMVKAYTLLATQDTAQLYAQVQETKAGIALQKAKLNQLLAGASPESIATARDTVASAKEGLSNAYQNGLATLSVAYNAIYTADATALYVRNTYFLNSSDQSMRVQTAKDSLAMLLQSSKQSLDKATMGTSSDIDASLVLMIDNLRNAYNHLKVIRDQCDSDIYYGRVTATDKTTLDTQKINVNTALSSVVTSKQTITTDIAALQSAENQLKTLVAPPRETDIAVYNAQIQQAEAGLQNVLAQIRKKQIMAPIDGIVTQMNAEMGSLSGPNDIAVSMMSSGKFQIESYVPEIYISLVKVGDEADVTLDAYGQDTVFKAKVISTDPSQTMKDGVSTYRTKLELEDEGKIIKTGMTANVIITTEKKNNVIAIPQGFLKTMNGKKTVMVLEDEVSVNREVTIGSYSSSGYVEIIAGLRDGDVVIMQ